MHRNTNRLRALALGLAAVAVGTTASLYAAPVTSHRATSARTVSDTTPPKDTTPKRDTTPKPDTTKKP